MLASLDGEAKPPRVRQKAREEGLSLSAEPVGDLALALRGCSGPPWRRKIRIPPAQVRPRALPGSSPKRSEEPLPSMLQARAPP